MADVSVKMGVSGIGGFKSAMTEAAAAVKSASAALKLNEAQLKATGDKETYLQNKMAALKQQVSAQTIVVQNARAAWEQLLSNGADPMSKSVQDMQTKYLQANEALITMTGSLKQLESGSEGAAAGTDAAAASADKLSGSLNGINKKISLDQVISGINTITSGLENAGRKAIEVGEKIWSTIMDAAKWSDDTATQATMYGVDVETYQKMVKVFDTQADITAEAYFKARQKIQKAVNDGSQDQIDVFKALGIDTTEGGTSGKWGDTEGIARNWESVFWEVGDKLRSKVESGEISQDTADVYAQALFGRGWQELNPLFAMGEEAFKAAVDEQTTATKEAVENNAALNDSVVKLKEDWQSFQVEVLGAIAPELTKVTDSLSGLVNRFTEYAQSDEGQELLKSLGEAVKGLFTDLTSIDPESVLEGLTGVFQGLRDTFSWIAENKESVVAALKGILAGWAGLKLTGGALKLLQLINGIKGLRAGADTASIAAAGAASGSTWGAAFATAATAAAPWLFAYIASKAIPDENKLGKEERVEASTYTNTELDNLREWVSLQNELKTMNDAYGTDAFDAEKYASLTEKIAALGDIQNSELGSRYWDYLVANNLMPGESILPTDFLDRMAEELAAGGPVEIEATPEVQDNAAALIAEQVGTVVIPAELSVGGIDGGDEPQKANGIAYVPWDGYAAILHKGERVVPAREVSSRNYNSNLYVESMYMNNGMDAQGLAAAMAAANRRTMSGYGS